MSFSSGDGSNLKSELLWKISHQLDILLEMVGFEIPIEEELRSISEDDFEEIFIGDQYLENFQEVDCASQQVLSGDQLSSEFQGLLGKVLDNGSLLFTVEEENQEVVSVPVFSSIKLEMLELEEVVQYCLKYSMDVSVGILLNLLVRVTLVSYYRAQWISYLAMLDWSRRDILLVRDYVEPTT